MLTAEYIRTCPFHLAEYTMRSMSPKSSLSQAEKNPSRTTSASAIQQAAAPGVRRGDRNESLTVLRACDVLKAFHHLGEELSLNEVVDRTRLPKTTVFRLLRTLIHGNLLERASSGVWSGQPMVENGQRAEENQVSSTS